MNKYMRAAISLAKKGKGKVYPNPLVGCVIVKDNKIIGKGWHKCFGANHAEINALLDAGKNSQGADLYVTLEPCNSYGKKPPCTQAIIKAGIKRVFYAVKDTQVKGSKKVLNNAGIKVYSGLSEKESKILVKDYFLHLKKKNKVSVKAAMTLDGKIATKTYDSKWITSEKSRSFTHALRTKYDAILVGANTALKDNPFLTSHGKGKNPVRVVIDSKLKLKKNSNLLNISLSPTVVFYDEKIKKVPNYYKKDGIVLAPVNIARVKNDFSLIIDKLNKISLKTILIEGGGETISSALFSNSVDDLYLFIAPKITGGKEAVSVVGGKGVSFIKDSVKIKNMKARNIGQDLLITGRIK